MFAVFCLSVPRVYWLEASALTHVYAASESGLDRNLHDTGGGDAKGGSDGAGASGKEGVYQPYVRVKRDWSHVAGPVGPALRCGMGLA